MPKWKKIVLAIFATLVVVGVCLVAAGIWFIVVVLPISYAQDVSQLTFPETRRGATSVDNMETCQVGYFRTTPEEAADFIVVNKFQPHPTLQLADIPWLDMLDSKHLNEPEGFDPHYLKDARLGAAWLVIVDKTSGGIWWIVQYGDVSGDYPAQIQIPGEQEKVESGN